jgi:hypothetical protein
MTRIGTTSIDLLPLCLGGKVFGWTAEERRSFVMLDDTVVGTGTQNQRSWEVIQLPIRVRVHG